MFQPGSEQLSLAINRVGELLQAQGQVYRIVIIGGAAMNLLGFVRRTTSDVDILAFGDQRADMLPIRIHPPPEPLPAELIRAAEAVARAMDLRLDWLNALPAGQWKLGLPPGLEDRVEWRTFSSLEVGLVARQDLVFLKLYAAADDTGPKSVHFQDLVALAPSDEELEAARIWVVAQDTGLAPIVEEVVRRARDAR